MYFKKKIQDSAITIHNETFFHPSLVGYDHDFVFVRIVEKKNGIEVLTEDGAMIAFVERRKH